MKTLLCNAYVAMAMLTIPVAAGAKGQNDKKLVINGTGKTVVMSINSHAQNGEKMVIKAPHGFKVTPTSINANGNNKINITLTSQRDTTYGELILRCGDVRKYVSLVGIGTPLQVKKLNQKNLAKGNKNQWQQAFQPGKNGYTIEFQLKSMEDGQVFNPWFVDANGHGFQANIAYNKVALQNSYERNIENPLTAGREGGGKFYNNDGLNHTYRIAVTADGLAYIYRDGVFLKCTRINDYAPRDFFAEGKGKRKDNLLKNGDFEGEFELTADKERAEAVEGWDIVIGDRWNSEQKVQKLGLDNQLDIDNHVFWIRPYKWRAGWSDGILEQVVDVVPGEKYSLSALAKGGTSKKQGKNLGKLTISEVQDRSKHVSTTINSEEWEQYQLGYTPSKDCHQLAIQISDGRGGWGGDITPVYVDNVALSGVGRTYSPKFGFKNQGADVVYFTIDETGAYAPETPTIDTSF